jgi:hypothetical protein
MGLDLPLNTAGSQLDLAREDVDAVQRLKQNYPPHILASLFEKEYKTIRKSNRCSQASSAVNIYIQLDYHLLRQRAGVRKHLF